MVNIQDKNNFNRRRVLKMGATSLAAMGGVGIGSAAGSEVNHFVGVAYNPRTGKEYGEAIGKLNRVPKGEMRGVIQLPQYSIPISARSPNSTRDRGFTTDRYWITAQPKMKNRKSKNGMKTVAKIISARGASVSGWVRNPRTGKKDAFFLGNKKAGYSQEKVHQGLKPILEGD
ncbi:MAG: hypothetical protein V5A34_11330 [Halapricum sp.]